MNPRLEPSAPMRRGVACSRLSKADIRNDNQLAAQDDRLIEIARKWNVDLRPEDILHDDGYQGDDFRRPSTKEARRRVADGEASVVIYDNTDRFTRSPRLGYQYLDEVQTLGGDILTGDLGFLPRSDDPDPSKHLIMALKFAGAANEKRDISRRVKDKMRDMLKNEEVPGRAAFGYLKVNKKLVIDPVNAKWLRKIFEWRIKGQSYRDIRDMLIAAGVEPPKGGAKKPAWRRSALVHITKNQLYTGVYTYGRREAVEPKKHRKNEEEMKNKKSTCRIRPKDQWKQFAVPALISRETFEAAQLTNKRNQEWGAGRPPAHVRILTGKLWCKCGQRFQSYKGTKHADGSTLERYRCAAYINGYHGDEYTPGTCTNGSIAGGPAEAAVWDVVVSIFRNIKDLEKRFRSFAQLRSMKKPADMERLQDRAAALLRQIQFADDRAIEAADDTPVLTNIQKKIRQLTAERRGLLEQMKTVKVVSGDVTEMLKIWKTLGDYLAADLEPESKRKILGVLVDRVTVEPSQDVAGGQKGRFIEVSMRIPTGVAVVEGDAGPSANCINTPREVYNLRNFFPYPVRRLVA